MVIFDTNILIELYRGNLEVQEKIRTLQSDSFYISAITAAEFLVGAKNKDDLLRIENQLKKYTVLPVNREITDLFLEIFKKHTLSRRPDIADTLIAAIALYHDIAIYTLNKKHFQFLSGFQLV